uniref:GOST seven transmembrane domain-containing protein n=2 Tax=Phaeomonas parva TaxID=124430 RepID=A0A7S1XJK7_9STRA|mmetsp:Transcript_14234/g.42624  ORF Transcript_14234/g.42624 Transcript_14234/m.42624 type:complete len:261 (+) Transcript_14234:845-1627(+)
MMVLRRSAPRTVVHIHKLMAVLVMFKVMTLLFDGVRYQVIGHTGHADGWTVVFYIFTVLRSISLFVVILLIGMGWSLLKPSLNEREKKIIFFVLTLQVLDNIAFLVVDETAPGSQSYLQWRDVLHLVDIICCCAILFPIVWSIRHLRQGAGTDGKMAANLNRLETFRYFYIMVISYIYFTRIVVYLTAAVIPFQLSWLKVFLEEAATLLFYVLTGVKFRPAEDNPYVKLSQEDDDDTEEFGLDDEGVELLEQPKTVLTKV